MGIFFGRRACWWIGVKNSGGDYGYRYWERWENGWKNVDGGRMGGREKGGSAGVCPTVDLLVIHHHKPNPDMFYLVQYQEKGDESSTY